MIGAEVKRGRIAGGRLAELYLRHSRESVRLAYLLTGDEALAEDLVQDAFTRLAGRLTHLRSSVDFQAYLRRTVVNLANSYFRRKKVERTYPERHRNDPYEGVAEPDLATKEALRRALLALPRRQRTAIALRFYLDLSESQTAELMHVRRGTVKSLVSRGMENLRPLIRGD